MRPWSARCTANPVATTLQLVASGLALGTIYALIALGFVVIYRASQVFNFAQGELVTFGAFVMVWLGGMLPWAVAVPATMVLTGLLAAGAERLILRPLVGRDVVITIILTIFLGLILRVMIMVVFGPAPRGMPTPWESTASVGVAGAQIFLSSIGAVVAGAVALLTFRYLIQRSRIGVAMRATSSDQEAALSLGIPVGRVFGFAWFLAGAFAALAGIFLGMFPRTVDTNLGFIALKAFPVVIVGGLDSAWGVVVAGLILGVVEVLTQGYVNPVLGQFGQNFHEVLPYLIMILFLSIRPYGIAGRAEVERV
jgi:branched-chain amino acid transport system permease protein